MELGLRIFQDYLPFVPQQAIGAAGKLVELCKLRSARRATNKRTLSFLNTLFLGR